MRLFEISVGMISVGCLAAAVVNVARDSITPERRVATAVARKTAEPQFDETVRLVFERAIPNVPGKSLIALEVTYPPDGKSPPHFHAGSAFIYAHVLSGAIRSQVDGEPARVYRVGEGFYEDPGSHHKISENVSASEPASLLAVFIADPKDTLTVPELK
jgi:quercetin dioxygenase-like cupin family protein